MEGEGGGEGGNGGRQFKRKREGEGRREYEVEETEVDGGRHARREEGKTREREEHWKKGVLKFRVKSANF